MSTKTGYMLFMAEAPLIGLRPHPAWAPQDELKSADAEGYFAALGAYETREAALKDAEEDHQIRIEEVEAGNLEDADEVDDIFEICVHDDGRIEVFQDAPRCLLAEYTIAQVYDAFGMTLPKPKGN